MIVRLLLIILCSHYEISAFSSVMQAEISYPTRSFGHHRVEFRKNSVLKQREKKTPTSTKTWQPNASLKLLPTKIKNQRDYHRAAKIYGFPTQTEKEVAILVNRANRYVDRKDVNIIPLYTEIWRKLTLTKINILSGTLFFVFNLFHLALDVPFPSRLLQHISDFSAILINLQSLLRLDYAKDSIEIYLSDHVDKLFLGQLPNPVLFEQDVFIKLQSQLNLNVTLKPYYLRVKISNNEILLSIARTFLAVHTMESTSDKELTEQFLISIRDGFLIPHVFLPVFFQSTFEIGDFLTKRWINANSNIESEIN